LLGQDDVDEPAAAGYGRAHNQFAVDQRAEFGSPPTALDPSELTPAAAADSNASAVTTKYSRSQLAWASRRIRRFVVQYQICRQLQDAQVPGLVRCQELYSLPVAGLPFTLPCMVLDWFDGPTLKLHFSNPKYVHGFGVQEFAHIALQLLDTISALHQQEIIHRDISASNILYLPTTGEVRVIDFGISSTFEAALTSPLVGLQGTIHYLSPEQTGRTRYKVDWRTDIYSLGVVFYQLLTGAVPFRRQPAAPNKELSGSGNPNPLIQLLDCICTELPLNPCELVSLAAESPRSSSVPLLPVLGEIVLKCLAKDPSARYQSASAIRVDIEAAAQLQHQMDKLRASKEIATKTVPVQGDSPGISASSHPSSGFVSPVAPRFPLALYDSLSVFRPSKRLYGRQEAIQVVGHSLGRLIQAGPTSKTEVLSVRGLPGPRNQSNNIFEG
jgi:serine/threonine protein kinase